MVEPILVLDLLQLRPQLLLQSLRLQPQLLSLHELQPLKQFLPLLPFLQRLKSERKPLSH
jgi:hypothetical protein